MTSRRVPREDPPARKGGREGGIPKAALVDDGGGGRGSRVDEGAEFGGERGETDEPVKTTSRRLVVADGECV